MLEETEVDTTSEDALTPAQRRVVELDRRKAEVVRFFDEYAEALEALIKESGLGAHFQDEEGVVYQTAVPRGRYVYFDKYCLNRTRRGDERAGTLSKPDAAKLGYDLG